jgi:hypothetical protein
MLAALILQLFLRLPDIPEGLKTIYTRIPEITSLRILLKLFKALGSEFNRTFIILDAPPKL